VRPMLHLKGGAAKRSHADEVSRQVSTILCRNRPVMLGGIGERGRAGGPAARGNGRGNLG
jgi:hypothetical protein